MHRLDIIVRRVFSLIGSIICLAWVTIFAAGCADRNSSGNNDREQQKSEDNTNNRCDTTKIVYNINNTNNLNISIIEEEVNIDIKIKK